jgi:simple sugar transport system permease protein
MVIFSLWSPYRAVLGALLFGGLTALQFFFQATGVEVVPVYILRMLPYLLTIGVLVLVMHLGKSGKGKTPGSLGMPFRREG